MVTKANDGDFGQFLSSDDVVAVKYYADWCGSCKLFAPKYRRISDEEQFTNVRFLEVNAEENPAARKSAGVDNLPFLAVFKNGQLVEGSATSKEDYFRGMLDKAIQS